ncbi:hypothetical protein ACFP81_01455 [Deinococcus lacus]|uniref:MFS transporter n=1 Tax=Deinococcus lacus TaxID=392561 RepID=A0ABW1YBI6_9DEIO
MLVASAALTLRGAAHADRAARPTSAAAQPLPWVQLFQLPAFLWVFITRVLFALGQYSVQPFINYYTQDVLREPAESSAPAALLGGIIAASILSALFGGA